MLICCERRNKIYPLTLSAKEGGKSKVRIPEPEK